MKVLESSGLTFGAMSAIGLIPVCLWATGWALREKGPYPHAAMTLSPGYPIAFAIGFGVGAYLLLIEAAKLSWVVIVPGVLVALVNIAKAYRPVRIRLESADKRQAARPDRYGIGRTEED